MIESGDAMLRLVASELAKISDSEVLASLRTWLVEPNCHLRNWDYGDVGERYPCWTVIEDSVSDTAIVYSEHGFGPRNPWGLVWLSDLWFGMDSGWYPHLEDAFIDSHMVGDLPIWNVIGRLGDGKSITVATSLGVRNAFSTRDRVAAEDRNARYHVVYRSERKDERA